MNLIEKAKALYDLGFQVVPVNVVDGKKKITFSWSSIVIKKDNNNEHLIKNYFADWQAKYVAVVHPTIGAVDVDVKDGKDGFAVLKEFGYPLSETLSYDTPSGGKHFIYRFEEGTTKASPINDGVKDFEITGVDRQVNNGLAIWYGDVPTQEQLDNLPMAPMWAYDLEKPSSTAPKYDVDWTKFATGQIDPKLQSILDKVPTEISHNSMIRTVWALMSEGAKDPSMVGLPNAMDTYSSMYLREPWNTEKYRNDFELAVQGAKDKIKIGQLAPLTEEEKFEQDVKDAMYRAKVSKTAQKRLLQEHHKGGKWWTWEELENERIEWTVQNLLYTDSQNGLVGRSQLGKTHLLISLICHMALEKPWFDGIKVKKQKVLYITSEGTRGITSRFKDWCEAYDEDWNEVKKYVQFASEYVLNLEIDVEDLQAKASEFKPDVIIFDTLSSNSSIENENDASDMAELLHLGRSIYDNAIVLWVHHPSEATRFQVDPKPRGSSVFKSNLDNMMTITEDKKFLPHNTVEPYSNGKEVRFLTLSTDDEEHGGKSKEGAPITIRGLYLWEYKRGSVVMAQAIGEDTHPDNVVIKKVFENWSSKTISTKDFWAKADELGLKDAEDKDGGWTNQKSADRMLEKAETRGLVIATRAKGQPTIWSQFDALEWAKERQI